MPTLTIQLIRDELQKLGYTPTRTDPQTRILHYRNPTTTKATILWHDNTTGNLKLHNTYTPPFHHTLPKGSQALSNAQQINIANPTFNIPQLTQQITHWLTTPPPWLQ